jgi:hypothetical protein
LLAAAYLLAPRGAAADGASAAAPAMFRIQRSAQALTIKAPNGTEALRYQLTLPEKTALSVESACFFHPLRTPNGVAVTDLAPDDHRHHRGVFLGWVEMHGAKNGDFWGWGEPAPKVHRRIVHGELSDGYTLGSEAGFTARNDWRADGTVMLQERLRAVLRRVGFAHVLDLTYTLTPAADLEIARWAFGGFCVRGRKDGSVEYASPAGLVTLPNPVHTKPETDWPDAPWYHLMLRLAPDITAGCAVINHPRNPPTLWHNHRDLRMLNPCTSAPAALKLAAGKPLVLRYRVVAHDGPRSDLLLNRLTSEWRATASKDP